MIEVLEMVRIINESTLPDISDGGIGFDTTFAMNDNTRQTYRVVGMKSHKYDAMTIQISKVIDTNKPFKLTKEGALLPYGYIYEEIDNTTDLVQYCRFMGEDNIKRNYPWARDLFK